MPVVEASALPIAKAACRMAKVKPITSFSDVSTVAELLNDNWDLFVDNELVEYAHKFCITHQRIDCEQADPGFDKGLQSDLNLGWVLDFDGGGTIIIDNGLRISGSDFVIYTNTGFTVSAGNTYEYEVVVSENTNATLRLAFYNVGGFDWVEPTPNPGFVGTFKGEYTITGTPSGTYQNAIGLSIGGIGHSITIDSVRIWSKQTGELITDSLSGYSHRLPIPNDCLHMQTVKINDEPIKYEINDDRIMCDINLDNDIPIAKYIRRVDESDWTPNFKLLVTYRMAAMILNGLVRRDAIAKNYNQMADDLQKKTRKRQSDSETNKGLRTTRLVTNRNRRNRKY